MLQISVITWDIFKCIKIQSADISMCKLCFLNANNYLNVLKYIKHNKNKFPLTSTL